MRVTGSHLMALSIGANATNQERVAEATAAVSSGLRVARPSDDPVAWAAAQRANVRKILVGGENAAIEVGRERLAETDAALATIGDAVSQVRALAIQGANASYDATARGELALQVRALFEGALGAANRQAADGEFLLAGTMSTTAPFTPAGLYLGDATMRALSSGSISSIAGASLTSAAGVDVLPLLDRVATALATNDTAALAATLDELGAAVQQVGLARTRGGSAINLLDTTRAANAQLDENLTREIARNVEMDTIESATNLAKATQSLEASRLVTSHIVSLLDPRMMGL